MIGLWITRALLWRARARESREYTSPITKDFCTEEKPGTMMGIPRSSGEVLCYQMMQIVMF